MTEAKHLPGFEERWAEPRRIRVRYFAGGPADAPPVVLVHGLGGAAANWTRVAPALARQRRVLVPELPGHGLSAPLPAAPGLAAFADAVAGVMEREGVERAPVVGHSMGGAVALRLALRRPERVEALVLAAPAGIRSSTDQARRMLWIVGLVQPGRRIAPYRRRFAASPVGRWLAFWHWGAADPVALDPETAEAFLSGPGLHTDTWTAWQALVVDDVRGELDELRCPVLVVWGADDNQLPLEDAVEYARRLHAPLRVIPDCGHLLIGERPDACLDAIEGFLAGNA
jgi:pimeloyl-ACP methyl ester carboxylesterase